jgi:putative endonuclease
MNNYHSGKIAEFLARIYMRCHGYRIVVRNYVTGRGSTAGEIDFIAVKNKTLVFVEVKKRQNYQNAAYAVTPTQKRRIIRGAQNFLQHHKQYADYDIRFDAILLYPPFNICHLCNVWLLSD